MTSTLASLKALFDLVASQTDVRLKDEINLRPTISNKKNENEDSTIPSMQEIKHSTRINPDNSLETTQSSFLTPSDETYDLLDGSPVDLASGNMVQQFFSPSGQLEKSFYTSVTEIPMDTGHPVLRTHTRGLKLRKQSESQ